MDNLNIPIILGTARDGRESIKVAKYIKSEIKNKVQTEIIDVKDYDESSTIPAWIDNPKIEDFSKKIDNSDGIILVCPEYNHGYPGEFKIFFDGLYKEYNRKPIGIIGVSSGGIAGARVVEMLRQVVIAAEMVPIKNALYFPNVSDKFDEKGNIIDQEEYKERIEGFMSELKWFAQVLKEGRENYPNE
jgi:NAD(P)H-dependent FMN reductase